MSKMYGVGETVKREKPEYTSRSKVSTFGSGFGESGQQQQKRIMIIDDDPDTTFTLRTVLEQNGFKTDSYTNPVLAYENFREGLYDLILLDIKLQVVDGFLLYQKIRKIDSKVKICFLTATEYFHEEIRKEHGFNEFNQEFFLRKPIEMKDLLNTTNKLLESC
jgi:DNA-binding response OmpR family regulator